MASRQCKQVDAYQAIGYSQAGAAGRPEPLNAVITSCIGGRRVALDARGRCPRGLAATALAAGRSFKS